MANFPVVMNPTDLTTALAQSQAEIVTNDEVLVNTTTIQHGWILWSGGRPQKSFVGFQQPLPTQMEPIGEDYPSEARSFQGALIDDGEPLAFDTNSYGGRKGIDVMLGKIKAHSAEGSQYLFPRVKLTSENYANKKRGGKLTYNPVFEIMAWCDNDGNEEPAANANAQVEDKSEDKEAPAEEPKRRQRRKKKAA